VDRRPTAIAFKLLMAVLLTGTALGWTPLPESLDAISAVLGRLAALIWWAGCLVSFLGLAWGLFLDVRDGLAIEAFGLLGIALGAAMYAYALTQVVPFRWLPFAMAVGLCGFAVTQYTVIWYHRRKHPPPHPEAGR
jgi:hypothetical protein